MSGERFVVLGLARARARWFGEVSRWATSGAIPAEFCKCLSVEEVRARLGSGRAHSAVLLDGGLPGIDRDLLDVARAAGAVLVVADERVPRDWSRLGASAVLPPDLTAGALLEALEAHARRIGRGDRVELPGPVMPRAGSVRGRLIAVTGPGGTGASVTAMALAGALAADPGEGGLVCLADLALDADQAVLHDVGDIVPGVPELVEAHRGGELPPDAVRAGTFFLADAGYHLLLGLRRHHEWTAIRPRAFDAALAGLRGAFRAVVADVDGDVEGEAACGSVEVQERNAMARAAVLQADAVVVVGGPAPHALARLVRQVAALAAIGVEPGRIVPVVNRAPRRPRWRAERARAFADLVPFHLASAPGAAGCAPLVFLHDRRRLDDGIRDGGRVTAAFGEPLARAVAAAVRHLGEPDGTSGTAPPSSGQEVAVVPGTVGSWTDA